MRGTLIEYLMRYLIGHLTGAFGVSDFIGIGTLTNIIEVKVIFSTLIA